MFCTVNIKNQIISKNDYKKLLISSTKEFQKNDTRFKCTFNSQIKKQFNYYNFQEKSTNEKFEKIFQNILFNEKRN